MQHVNTDRHKQSLEKLLRDPAKIHDRLNVLDKHMQAYTSDRKKVALPAGYEFMQPLADDFGNHLEGFANFILQLREHFDRRTEAFTELQKLYRRVNGRWVQQSRRARMARATQKAESLFGPVSYPNRVKWMTEVEHGWAQRRLKFLEDVRKKSGDKHLSTEDRAEVLLEFWDIVDTEIYQGELPKWS